MLELATLVDAAALPLMAAYLLQPRSPSRSDDGTQQADSAKEERDRKLTELATGAWEDEMYVFIVLCFFLRVGGGHLRDHLRLCASAVTNHADTQPFCCTSADETALLECARHLLCVLAGLPVETRSAATGDYVNVLNELVEAHGLAHFRDRITEHP